MQAHAAFLSFAFQFFAARTNRFFNKLHFKSASIL